MDGHPFRFTMRRALTAAALVLTVTASLAAPAAAEEATPQWLSTLGAFVRDGLAPPRTAEDVLREEAAPKPAPKPVPVAAPAPAPAPEPVRVAQPQPAPPPAPPAAIEPPSPPAAAPVVNAAPAPAPPKPETAFKKTEPPQPSPRAVAPAELKPRPVVPVAVRPAAPPAPPPPEPLTGSRIAATATLDQAMRLGGPASLYAQRVKKPQPAAP